GDRGPLLVDDVVPRKALPLRVELDEDPAPVLLEGRHRDGDFLLRRRRRQHQDHHDRQTQPSHSLHPCVSALSLWSHPFLPLYSRLYMFHSALKHSPSAPRFSHPPAPTAYPPPHPPRTSPPSDRTTACGPRGAASSPSRRRSPSGASASG